MDVGHKLRDADKQLFQSIHSIFHATDVCAWAGHLLQLSLAASVQAVHSGNERAHAGN